MRIYVPIPNFYSLLKRKYLHLPFQKYYCWRTVMQKWAKNLSWQAMYVRKLPKMIFWQFSWSFRKFSRKFEVSYMFAITSAPLSRSGHCHCYLLKKAPPTEDKMRTICILNRFNEFATLLSLGMKKKTYPAYVAPKKYTYCYNNDQLIIFVGSLAHFNIIYRNIKFLTNFIFLFFWNYSLTKKKKT